MEISYTSSIDTHNLHRRYFFFKKICSQAQRYQLEIKTNRKKELVRTFSQQNQHTHRDKHEEKNLQKNVSAQRCE